MVTINKLTKTDTVAAGDLFPIYKSGAGDARAAAASVLLAYMQANLTFTTQGRDAFTTQYASPSATGFTVNLSDGADNDSSIHLILTPTATFASGIITYPISTTVVDKQELLINCTQVVTALTNLGNGSTVTGAPASLAANAFYRMKYDAITTTWFRVG